MNIPIPETELFTLHSSKERSNFFMLFEAIDNNMYRCTLINQQFVGRYVYTREEVQDTLNGLVPKGYWKLNNTK